MRLSDGTTTTTPLDRGAIVESIAIGHTAVFLAVYTIAPSGPGVGSIQRVPLGGGSVSTIVSGLGHPTAIALDEDYVYFNDEPSFGNGELLQRAALDGSGLTTLANVPATSIAVDGHAVYYAAGDSIAKIDKTSLVVTTVTTGLESPAYLRVRGGNVYWVNDTTPSGDDPHPPYAVMTSCK